MYSQPSTGELIGPLIGGIVLAFLAYGAFPLLYIFFSPKVTFKTYRRVCFAVNFLVFLAFCLINGTYNAVPYVLWTFVVTAMLKNFNDFISEEEKQAQQAEKQKDKPQPGLKATEPEAQLTKTPRPSSEPLPVIPQEIEAPINTNIEEKAFCRNCGAQIEISDKFCYKCGSKSPFPSFVSADISKPKQEQQESAPVKSIPLPEKESPPQISTDPYAQHNMLYSRCKELVKKYDFDSAALLPIKEMVDTAIREKVDLPDTDIEKMAHTAVFNAMAERLMQHKYAGNDGFFGLSLQGECYLDSLKTISDQMIENNYLSSSEREDLMRNIVDVSHQRVYQETSQKTHVPVSVEKNSPTAPPAKSNGFLNFVVIIIIAAIFVLILMGLGYNPQETAPTPTPSPTHVISTPKPTVRVVPAQVMPANGTMFKNPSYVKLCPFSVSVRGSLGYYVYLEYLYPSESYNSRHLEGNPKNPVEDIAFFVRPGCTVEMDVPVGVYKLYYATGEEWFGKNKLFGEDTVYNTSYELLEFYTDYTSANGVSLELWAQTGGNFDTVEIDEAAFPG